MIDPSGTIRWYQADANLNLIQSMLATFTGATLNQSWPISGHGNPSKAIHLDHTDVTFTYEGADSPVTQTNPDITVSAIDQFFPTNTTTPWQDEFPGLTVVLPSGSSFDPNQDITLTTTEAFTRSYWNSVNIPPTSPYYPNLGVFDLDSWNQLIHGGPPPAALAIGSAPITNSLDGTSFTTGPFKISELMQSPNPPPGAPAVLAMTFDLALTEPFYRSFILQSDVNADTTLSSAVQTSVTASLTDGQSKMTKRDFVRAAASMQAAATTLRNASASANLQDPADWIAAHVSWLSTH